MGGDWVLELLVGPDDDAELAALGLWDRGATAVRSDEARSGTTLVASFPTAEATQQVAAEVGGRAVEVPPASWRDTWRDFALPVPLGRLVVVPAWRPVALGADQEAILIDPAACFGSGSHPSTRLALGVLARRPPIGQRVLDVGSGSGILSVAAARLGATYVTGIDIDPDAEAVGRANAERNGVAARVAFATTPIEDLGGRGADGWDVALVNVTAGVHATVAEHVVARVKPGGHLILSGLLPGQWRHVAGAYAGCACLEQLGLDGWVGALLRVEERGRQDPGGSR